MNDIEATIIYCKNLKYLIRRINYIPDFTCGIYVLIKDSGRMYIGASSNLKSRLLFHSKVNGPRVTLRMTDKLDYIIFCEAKNIDDACFIEKMLIKKYLPYYNKIHK